MKFATALTLFTTSSAMKLKLSDSIELEDFLRSNFSELNAALHACTKTELEDAIERYKMAPKDAQQLRDEFARYNEKDRTIGAFVFKLLNPTGEAEGMNDQSEIEELEDMIFSIWDCY